MELVVEQEGIRLDVFLKTQGGAHSRMFWKGIIEEGSVTVNGKVITKPSLHLKKGDKVIVTKEIPEVPDELVIEPDPSIKLNIVYEDEDVVVINKPAGLLVHPMSTRLHGTLVNGLVARYPAILGVGENSLRPGIVHRLDKDTSGLVVVAKTQEAFLFLKEQFSHRDVKKTYLALVEGIPQKPFATISYPIRSSTQNHLKKVAIKGMSARLMGGGGREAVTDYRVQESFGDKYALLEVHPKTGRTHQIRVHLQAIGHPVVGDTLYGREKGKGKKEKESATVEISRQFLHAAELTFTAPSGKQLSLSASLPKDLEEVLQKMRKQI